MAILRPLGDLRHQPLDVLGAVALLQGDPQEAVACFEERLEMHRRQGGNLVQDLGNLGIAMGHLGDHIRAAAYFHEALSLVRDTTNVDYQGVCLLGVAGFQRSARHSAQLLGTAQTAFETSSWVTEPLYQAEIERLEKAARVALGEADFEAAYAEGNTMPVDQAIAMVLADSDDWIDGEFTSFDWGPDGKTID